MSIDRSETNSKICKAFFSEEELSAPLDFCKNRDDAWKLIHKLEERGHRVFTKQFPPVYYKIDKNIDCAGSDFNEAVCKAALALIEQSEAAADK